MANPLYQFFPPSEHRYCLNRTKFKEAWFSQIKLLCQGQQTKIIKELHKKEKETHANLRPELSICPFEESLQFFLSPPEGCFSLRCFLFRLRRLCSCIFVSVLGLYDLGVCYGAIRWKQGEGKCHLHPEEDWRLWNLYKGVVEWPTEQTHF